MALSLKKIEKGWLFLKDAVSSVNVTIADDNDHYVILQQTFFAVYPNELSSAGLYLEGIWEGGW